MSWGNNSPHAINHSLPFCVWKKMEDSIVWHKRKVGNFQLPVCTCFVFVYCFTVRAMTLSRNDCLVVVQYLVLTMESTLSDQSGKNAGCFS